MKKLSLFLLSLFSMLKSVSAADFYDYYKLNINFGFIKDVELWVFVITWAILFIIVYTAAARMKFFKDNNKNAAIFSVLVSIAAMVGSPVSTLVMGAAIISPLIVYFLFFLAFVIGAIGKLFSKPAGWSSEEGRAFKKLRNIAKGLGTLYRDLKSGTNHLPEESDSAYESEVDKLAEEIQETNQELDNMRIRAREEDPGGESGAEDDFRKAINFNQDAIHDLENKEVSSAKKNIKKSEKSMKRGLKKAGKYLRKIGRHIGGAGKQLREDEEHYREQGVKEIEEKASQIISKYKSDYNEMIKRLQEGVYTQDQAKEWQERTYNEFRKDLSELNYSEEQINPYWEKEIWSQGVGKEVEEASQSSGADIKDRSDEWKKFIQNKIDKTKTVLKSKRRLKNVKEVKDKIRRELDDDNLLILMEHFEYSNAIDTWKNYFDEAIAYFESDERNRRDEKTWKSFEENVQKYISFLESVRDRL